MKALITILLLNMSSYLTAQTNIQGIVRDDNDGPVESATISLFKATDSNAIKTTVTAKDGHFMLSNLKTGAYHLGISAVGYVSITGASFNIREGDKLSEQFIFKLKKKSSELQSVVVVSKKPFIEQKSDRILVNVDASPANAGTSVMDVLEKSPGVSVDKDGNISLKGKQGVTVMIDNRPTYMSGAQLAVYLKSLPSSAIDQLEIMSNPSAKYDAAGNSGI